MFDVARVLRQADLVLLAGGTSMWLSFEPSAWSSLVSCCGRLSVPASTMFSCAGLVELAGSSSELAPTLGDSTLGVGTLGAKASGCLVEIRGSVSGGSAMSVKTLLSFLRSWTCLSPTQFCFPFNAARRSPAALTIASASVSAGRVMCLCKNCTVSHTRRAWVFRM